MLYDEDRARVSDRVLARHECRECSHLVSRSYGRHEVEGDASAETSTARLDDMRGLIMKRSSLSLEVTREARDFDLWLGGDVGMRCLQSELQHKEGRDYKESENGIRGSMKGGNARGHTLDVRGEAWQ